MPTEDYSHARRIARVRQLADWKGLNKVVGALSSDVQLSIKLGELVNIQKNFNGIGKTINNGDRLPSEPVPPTSLEITYDFENCSATLYDGKIHSINVKCFPLIGALSYKIFWRYNNIPNAGYESVISEDKNGPPVIPSDPNSAKTGLSVGNQNLFQDQSDVITKPGFTISNFTPPSGYDTQRITVYMYAYSDLAGTNRITNFPKTMLQIIANPGGNKTINKIFLSRTNTYNGSIGVVFVDDNSQYDRTIANLESKNIPTNEVLPPPPAPIIEVNYFLPNCSATLSDDNIDTITVSWGNEKIAQSYKLFWRFNASHGYTSVSSSSETLPPSDLNLDKRSGSKNLFQGQSDAIAKLSGTSITSFTISNFTPPSGYDTKRITVYMYAYSDIGGTIRMSNFPKTMLQFVGNPAGSTINKIFLDRSTYYSLFLNQDFFVDDNSPLESNENIQTLDSKDIT